MWECYCCPVWAIDVLEWVYFNIIKPSVVCKLKDFCPCVRQLLFRDWVCNANSRALLLHWLLLSDGEAHLDISDCNCTGFKETTGCGIWSSLDINRSCDNLQRRLESYASDVHKTWQSNRPHRKSLHLFNTCACVHREMRRCENK